MTHKAWTAKKIPPLLNCAPVTSILDRHPIEGPKRLIALGKKDRIVARVDERTSTEGEKVSKHRDWYLTSAEWLLLAKDDNLTRLLNAYRVRGSVEGVVIELRGPVFFERDGILNLVDELEPKPDRNGIRNSDTFLWEDWDAYEPEEIREYLEFPSAFVDAPISAPLPVDTAPKVGRGAPVSTERWQEIGLALIEIAVQQRLNKANFPSQAALSRAVLERTDDIMSEVTIKPFIRKVWEKVIDSHE